MNCLLCNTSTAFLTTFREKDYYRCNCCLAIMMDPAMQLSLLEEKSRYDEHNNDVEDPGYQEFVRPLVKAVTDYYGPEKAGLDYGAGPGPVAAHLLNKLGYKLNLFDPFYWPHHNSLSTKYDFIIASEVIEHFRHPFAEFFRLRSLLLPGGALFFMTELLPDLDEFDNWYYKKDPTHIFFYHARTLEWIGNEFNFQQLVIKGRLQILLCP